MAIDLIDRCRTAAAAYRRNAEPHIGETVNLSARDVMSYATLLAEAADELARRSAVRGDLSINADEFRKLVDEGRAFADTNREESFIADAELSCPHCGGSGHKDDVISLTTATKGQADE